MELDKGILEKSARSDLAGLFLELKTGQKKNSCVERIT